MLTSKHDPCRRLGFVRKDIAHRVGGAKGRRAVVVGVALKGVRRGGVPGEGLEIADGLAALGEEREATMPKATQTPLRVAAQLLHKALVRIQSFQLRFGFYLQITRKREWTRRDSNS